MPSYLSVLKLQNCSSQCSSCEFLRKIEEKLFWVIKAINEASATNFIINLSHILYVTSDAKALCSILYSSGNIQIKICWGPSVTLTWQKTLVSRGLKPWEEFTQFFKVVNHWLKQVLLLVSLLPPLQDTSWTPWCSETTAKLHHQSLNSGSAQVQILLVVCRRFAIVRFSYNCPEWK